MKSILVEGNIKLLMDNLI